MTAEVGNTLAEFYDQRSVLVTGGAGFLGSHLVDRLIALGARVRILDDLSGGFRQNLNPSAEFIHGDIRNPRDVETSMRGIQLVFHEAAQINPVRAVQDPLFDCDVNVSGTVRLLAAAANAGVARFVMASTNLYGDGIAEGVIREDAPILSLKRSLLSPYAASKAAAEAYLKVFNDEFGLPTVRLRYSNIYGPRQRAEDGDSGVIALFARWALSGKPLKIFGDGEQTRDFVFVADVVFANLLAGAVPNAAGDVFNISGGVETSVLELAHTLRDITGSASAIEFLPPRRADFRRVTVDISSARSILGWHPSSALADGLRQYVAWLQFAGLDKPGRE